MGGGGGGVGGWSQRDLFNIAILFLGCFFLDSNEIKWRAHFYLLQRRSTKINTHVSLSEFL